MEDDFEIVIRRIEPFELPALTATEQARWLTAMGFIAIMTKPDGTQVRIPEPWERGDELQG